MSNLNLNLYKIFCVVANSKSYADAAEKLNLSVPNISKQISNLEDQLDVKLFNRERDGVKLTEAGKELYEIVNKTISSFDFAEKLMKEKNDIENGKIAIGCPSHIASYYLMNAIEKAKIDYPNLDIELISSAGPNEMLVLLKEHKVDFIVTDIVSSNEDEIVIESLKIINNIFVSKTPLKIEDVKELEDLKYILNFDYTNSSKMLMQLLRKYNVEIKADMKCDITELRVDAAKRNMGIAYIMKEAVIKELSNNELYEVELPIELPSININLLYLENQLTKVDKKFIKEYLKK